MTELVFIVEIAPEGGYTARALDESIFTEAADLDSLKLAIRDAIKCHFDPGREQPALSMREPGMECGLPNAQTIQC